MPKKPFDGIETEEPEAEYDVDADTEWHEKKAAHLESVLGQAYEMMHHTLVTFEIGGGLNLYYYPCPDADREPVV